MTQFKVKRVDFLLVTVNFFFWGGGGGGVVDHYILSSMFILCRSILIFLVCGNP